MRFFQIFKDKRFYIHIGIILVLIGILFIGTFRILDNYTRHGDVYFLPQLEGMTIEQADEKGYTKAFEFVITDSVYSKTLPAGAIVMQKPFANSKVKKGRKVYVTVVASGKEKVKMPNLVDLSLRQAIVELDMAGLKIKQLDYVPDIARNAVLAQLYLGDTIAPDEQISKGEAITLVLGEGTRMRKVKVPLLIGQTLEAASDNLHELTLNVGNVIYLDGDTLNAVVYKQYPGALHNQQKNPGTAVDLWMKSGGDFDVNTHLDELINDSLELDLHPSYDFSLEADSLIRMDTIQDLNEPLEEEAY